MITEKDRALLQYLVDNTTNGTLRWEPTAERSEFTAPLRGKYLALVQRTNIDTLRLVNGEGEVMLTIDENDDKAVEHLWELARRNAFNTDKAIDEIIGGSS
jgi:hypothetical protein